MYSYFFYILHIVPFADVIVFLAVSKLTLRPISTEWLACHMRLHRQSNFFLNSRQVELVL